MQQMNKSDLKEKAVDCVVETTHAVNASPGGRANDYNKMARPELKSKTLKPTF
jgi:hypothetical protein